MSLSRVWALAVVALAATACATTEPPPPVATAPPPAPVRAAAPPAEVLPEVFTSERWIVAFARAGDTSESLAQRHLGDAGQAWRIEDYTGRRTFGDGEKVVIPRTDWNAPGVTAAGYELVPILTYHNVAPESKGRMVLGAKKFAEQMQYLKVEGYRVISMRRFIEAMTAQRQLPKRAVVLTFDDGYQSFRHHAAPILKQHGFTATLFVYLDYVGAGRNALSWQDLRELAAEGFDVQAHSKTHADLRRAPGEADAPYARRMQSELEQPMTRIKQQVGAVDALAYPYGYWDEHLLQQVRQHGYVAAFTVRRQANPTFVSPLRINRSQIYGEMTLEEFIRNLNVFHAEEIK